MGEWAGSSTARRELSGWSVKKAKAKKKRIEGVEWRGKGTTGRKGQEDEKNDKKRPCSASRRNFVDLIQDKFHGQ